MSGNLFTGSFAFSDVSAIQDNPEKARFNVSAKSVQANIDMLALLFGERSLEYASLRDASIQFSTPAQAPTEQPASSRSLPTFSIDHLELQSVTINVHDLRKETPTNYEIAIHQLDCLPLRSRYLWFDILFRANLNASLNGSVLRIENSETAGVRSTRLIARDIETSTLASLIGGPFALFESGLATVEITDEWIHDKRTEIDMAWKLSVDNATAKPPDSTPKLLAPLVQVAVDNINKTPQRWQFAFSLRLTESYFDGATSLNAKQIWAEALPVFIEQLANLSGVSKNAVQEKTTKAIDAVKGFLDERRKPNTPPEHAE